MGNRKCIKKRGQWFPLESLDEAWGEAKAPPGKMGTRKDTFEWWRTGEVPGAEAFPVRGGKADGDDPPEESLSIEFTHPWPKSLLHYRAVARS